MSSKIDTINKYSYLVGKTINKWTVLHIEYNRRHVDAFCRCECGTQKLVGVNNLINSLSKDCGCGRKKKIKRHSNKKFSWAKIWQAKSSGTSS